MWNLIRVGIILFGFSVLVNLSDGDVIGCHDNNGNPVDWFVLYKLPKLPNSDNPLVKDGVGQAYSDVNSQEWTLLERGITDTNHAVYYTLQQIYQNNGSEKVAYLLYNDEKPKGKVSFNHGHTKGVIALDMESGFWLVHSVPKFPPQATDGYEYPYSGTYFGQSFLCITMNTKYFNDTAQQLLYTYPQVYDSNVPETFAGFPALQDIVDKKHVQSPPWNSSRMLVSHGGQKFMSFAKFTFFGQDLYDGWLAAYFDSDLFVETWQNGKGRLDSNCSTPSHKVLNVLKLSLVGENFSEEKDHSKWAVTANISNRNKAALNWICIGDINRMESQKKRAGATVCGYLPKIWNNFQKIITDSESCQRSVMDFPHLFKNVHL